MGCYKEQINTIDWHILTIVRQALPWLFSG